MPVSGVKCLLVYTGRGVLFPLGSVNMKGGKEVEQILPKVLDLHSGPSELPTGLRRENVTSDGIFLKEGGLTHLSPYMTVK
jgi:hypothetical protein